MKGREEWREGATKSVRGKIERKWSIVASPSHSLHLVYGWLTTAFASALDCREVLLLWDRVIGFDSVEIIAGQLAVSRVSLQRCEIPPPLAVLAVAVLEFRALNLFQATCVAEAEVWLLTKLPVPFLLLFILPHSFPTSSFHPHTHTHTHTHTLSQSQEILSDLRCLKVLPLLQQTLFL